MARSLQWILGMNNATNNGANSMSREDLLAGLDKDIKDLTTYRAHVKTLRNGGHVENLSLKGAKIAVAGLKAVINNKRYMIAKLKQCEPNEFDEAFARFVK